MIFTLYNRILVILGYAGLFVAGVLSLAVVVHKSVPCGMSHGCEIVANDPTSKILGVPNAFIGLAGYLVLALLATYREFWGIGGKIGKVTVYLGYAGAALGTLASIVLTYISFTMIHAECIWCLSSAAIMTLTLLTYMLLGRDVENAPAAPAPGNVGPVLVGVMVFLAAGGVYASKTGFHVHDAKAFAVSDNDRLELMGADSHQKNPNGVVTVVEFGDLACPSCKSLYPQMEQAVATSGGKLRYVFHNFPLYMNPEHAAALPGATISEMAAEHGKFWEFLDLAYGAGGDPHSPPATGEDMVKFGTEVGLTEAEIRTRLVDNHDAAFMRVMKDITRAGEYKVSRTPTFIVIADGHAMQVVGGDVFDALNEPQFKKLLKGP